MRLKPFLILFTIGIMLAASEIVQGHIVGRPGQLIGTVIGYALGATLWGFPYCFFTRKKYKANLEKQKSV